MDWQSVSVLISDSAISERCNRYCKKCTNNVISCDYSIINGIYDTQKNAHFQWKNQKPEATVYANKMSPYSNSNYLSL